MLSTLAWRRSVALTRRELVAENIPKVMILRLLFMSLGFAIPTIVVFWQSHGLSMFQIMLLQAIFAVTVLVAEVPSGYIADLYGRKHTLVFGSFFLIAGDLQYACSYDFKTFLAGEIFIGIGIALISGADEALFYDSLKEIGEELNFKRLWGRTVSFEMGMGALNFAIGGLIASSISPRAPFIVGVVLYAIYPFVASTLVEPERGKPLVEDGHFRELARIACRALQENRGIRWIFLVSGSIFAFTQVGFWLYQPYFKECGIPLSWYGFIMAISSSSAAGFVLLAHRIEGHLGERKLSMLLAASIGASFFLFGTFVTLWSPIFILLQQFVRAVNRVVFSEHLNREIASETRATVVSLKSMSDKLFYTALLLPVGELVDEVGVVEANRCLGVAVSCIGLIVLLRRPWRNKMN
ncbi:MAG: MFS transporter [Bdellovibrionales bacterium]|nr:MFS transporter [Bdellovibrionales bacterium]